MTARLDVTAIGNAIMDVIARVDEDFLVRHDITRARMNLIDEQRCNMLYAALPQDRVETSGGSAGNTIAGVLSFGGRAAFCGKVADDRIGEAYAADMRRIGAEFHGAPLVGGPATARSMIAVTPDGERSMNTFLGASTEFSDDDITPEPIRAAAWTYLEGYLFDKPAAKRAFVKAAEIAAAGGRKTAVTLSDVFCVERHRDSFRHLVRAHMDLVFANEAELLALYETPDFDEALSQMRAECRFGAVTRSAKGSVVFDDTGVWASPAAAVVEVVDATGAGDAYAAGFLFGLARGMAPPECARLGHIAAAEVISHVGPRPQSSLAALAGLTEA